MAEIPVKREASGMPWWAWLFLALLVVGLLIWLFSGDEDTQTVAVAPVAPITETVASPGPITDLALIANTADRSALVGRQVQLANVPVLEVVGDRTFWVGPNANQRAFVVLNEVPTPGQPGVEGRFDVTPGQLVNVDGVMRNVSDPAIGGSPIEGLPADQQAVIHAQSLDIVERP